MTANAYHIQDDAGGPAQCTTGPHRRRRLGWQPDPTPGTWHSGASRRPAGHKRPSHKSYRQAKYGTELSATRCSTWAACPPCTTGRCAHHQVRERRAQAAAPGQEEARATRRRPRQHRSADPSPPARRPASANALERRPLSRPRLLQQLSAAEVRPQNFRDTDVMIGGLEVLDQGRDEPRCCNGGVVQGVSELNTAILVLVLQARAPCLPVVQRRAAVRLAELLQRREPGVDIVHAELAKPTSSIAHSTTWYARKTCSAVFRSRNESTNRRQV